MKIFITLVGILIIFYSVSITGEKTNEYVKVDVEIKSKTLKAGSRGELIIKFKPKSGIHINLDPPLSMKIDSSDAITSVGKLDIPKPTKEGYLDIDKPVKQSFTLSKSVKSKTIHIKGLISYFYCSAADGWCSRFKQPIDIPVNVAR